MALCSSNWFCSVKTMNELKYIRDNYKVPAKRGALIQYNSSCGPITLRIRSANNARLYCSPKDADPKDARRMILHPTWRIVYLQSIAGQPTPGENQ